MNPQKHMMLKLRQITRRLLETKQVDCIIGYEKTPFDTVCPVFIDWPEDAEKMVWNDRCIHNLTVYLKRCEIKGKRVALVSKGCDVKSIMILLQEGQIKRANIKIIGLDCYGQRGEKGRLLIKCLDCTDHRPKLYDYLVVNGESNVDALDVTVIDYSTVEAMERMSGTERLQFWKKHAAKCIRCYACREVCPLCYCVECFTDQNLPQYLPSSPSIQGNFLWLLMRSIDLAGRCTGCMECDRACPVDIPLYLLNKKSAKDIAELFGYEAGRSLKEKPPLAVFKEEDPDDGIL